MSAPKTNIKSIAYYVAAYIVFCVGVAFLVITASNILTVVKTLAMHPTEFGMTIMVLGALMWWTGGPVWDF